MPIEIRLWKIESEKPVPISHGKLDLESRLEEWILKDVSLLSNNFVLIGRQVKTEHGGIIDLLAMDHEGNLIIIELKRDKTPRDVVAQILDYASCVQGWGSDEIEDIAEEFISDKPLDLAFREKFQSDLPDVINERHRMYIIASYLDPASERIVKYLSEHHSIDINVVTFVFFKTADGEFLGRTFLLDESEVETRSQRKSKRKPALTWEDLEGTANQNNVLEIYQKTIQGLKPFFDSTTRTLSNVSLIGFMGENKSRNGIVSIFPGASSQELGLAVGINLEYLSEYFGIPEPNIREAIGDPNPEIKKRVDKFIYSGSYWVPCFSFTGTVLNRFAELLQGAKSEA